MRTAHRFLVIGIAAICAVIYLYTAAPFMLLIDSPILLAAIVSLGIAYPAEPVYVFLAHWFTYLPFGSVVFRIQIFSALLAAGSLLLLYRLAIRIMEKPISLRKKNQVPLKQPPLLMAGIFSMIALAFSYEFWSQAQNVETFTLDCFLELIILTLLLRDMSHKSVFKILAIVVVVCGIATGTDPPVVASVFPLVLFVAWQWRRTLGIKRLVFLFFLGSTGIVLAWSYLPIAEMRRPLVNGVDGSTIQGILTASTGYLSTVKSSKHLIGGFTWSPTIMLASTRNYFVMAWLYFTPVLLPFIALGAAYLWRKQRYFFFLLSLVVATNFLISVLYLSGNQESWFLQSDVIFALFIGAGYLWAIEIIANRVSTVQRVVFQGGMFFLAFIPLLCWWQTLDRHRWNFNQDYINNLYSPLQEPAILFGGGDLWIGTSLYVYAATTYKHGIIPFWNRGLYIHLNQAMYLASRSNIKMPTMPELTTHDRAEYSRFMNMLFADNIGKYHIYLTEGAFKDDIFGDGPSLPSLDLDESKFSLIPVGMVQEVVPKNEKHVFNLNDFAYHFSNGFPQTQPHALEQNYPYELQLVTSEIASSYDNAANYLMYQEQYEKAAPLLRKAYELDPKNPQFIGDLGMLYGYQNQPAKALEYFTKANANQPDNLAWLYNIALVEGQLGKIDEEKKGIKRIIDNPQVDATIKQTLIEQLNSLNQQAASSESSMQPKTSSVPKDWKQFTNVAMNLTFLYPLTLRLTQIKPQIVSLSDPTQPNTENELLIYSGEIPSGNPKNLWVPFHLLGQLQQSKPVQLPGFQAILYAYSDTTLQTQLLLLKHGQQLIALYYPEQLSVSQEVLNQIVRSITTVH